MSRMPAMTATFYRIMCNTESRGLAIVSRSGYFVPTATANLQCHDVMEHACGTEDALIRTPHIVAWHLVSVMIDT